MHTVAPIPLKYIGPIKILGDIQEDITVPLATYETPLWPSTSRGAHVSQLCQGITCTLVDEKMTRSILLEAPSASYAVHVKNSLESKRSAMETIVRTSSHVATLLGWHIQIAGKLMYIRFELLTGDASGHNMVTKAADYLIRWFLETFPQLTYGSISGNYCTDKKVSAVNGILGRGKNVIAEIRIPRSICQQRLKTTPEQLIDLNVKKNLIGTMLAGGLRSANAHFANMLLAFYLATGQDAANIIEGSQGYVTTDLEDDVLYFAVTLPNLIVGTVGNGKHHGFVRDNLELMGCLVERAPGENARRLALIAAATVLCGELSLMAAQTNQGELMECHEKVERSPQAQVHPRPRIVAG